jgi:hypothetical protein
MVTMMEIDQVRASWTAVLDVLEREDRIAWLAFFDARLASLDGSRLFLDYSDSQKFATAHEYGHARKNLYPALQRAIRTIFGVDLIVTEKP